MAISYDENFECPSGFQEEEVEGQLYHENLDDDSELWLIRLPSDIELSAIDKKKLFLSGNENPTTFETADGKVLDCFVDNSEISDVCLVLPQRSDKKLHEVKKVFKGSILISEGLYQGDKVVIKSENESEPIESLHTTEESHSISYQKHERKKRKRSRSDTKEQSRDSKNQQGDIDIKDEPLSSDFELQCHSQK